MNRLSRIVNQLFPPKPPTPQEVEQERQTLWWKRMEGLGHWRTGVLWCCNANSSQMGKGFFNPPDDADLNQACLHFFESKLAEVQALAKSSAHDLGIAIIAAGLLTYGQQEMVDLILDNMTPNYKTDHGAGRCILLPMLILRNLLPLPDDICRCTLDSGEIDINAARRWLRNNKSHLKWNADQECFVLMDQRIAPTS